MQLAITGSVAPQLAPTLRRYTALVDVTIGLSQPVPIRHLMSLRCIRNIKLRVLLAEADMLLALTARITKGGQDLVWPDLRVLVVSCGGAMQDGTCTLDACHMHPARCSKALSSVRGHAVDVVVRCTCCA